MENNKIETTEVKETLTKNSVIFQKMQVLKLLLVVPTDHKQRVK